MSRRLPVVDPDDPDLPVAGTGTLSAVRPSHRSRWRAAVLVAVHLAIAAHVAHFMLAGRTLSPVEPSEAMYTLELGQINAGFLFLVAALLATVVFGRFFCGWGCHLVALQDLCAWLMKKIGIRPQPFRSRLLLLVPVLVAFYMFAWPALPRLFAGGSERAATGWSNHLITEGFWDTFPGPLFAILTFLTCGFAAVYFLGAKGFCTYGCPYGALFVAADRISPARILVSDACDGCAHCTVTCTSNVRVHEEVRLYGMVVDPGCMKCMDCVSVCPKEALRFGFGTPSILRRRARPGTRPGRYALPLSEEVVVLVVGLAAALAFRGLYDGPPLLMAVGLGGITGFLALKAWHLLRRPVARLQNLTLKRAGSLQTAGRVVLATTALWMAFAAHSGFVQWHRFRGRTWLERTEAPRASVLAGAVEPGRYSAAHIDAAHRTLRHFELADRWGLVDVVEVKLGMAWGHLLAGAAAPAEAAIRAALARAPHRDPLHDNLIEFLLARGRGPEAVAALEAKIALAPPAEASDHFQLGGLLAGAGRLSEAARHYRAGLALTPDSAEARYNLGGLLRRMERPAEAIEHLRIARDLAPADVDTHIELGLALLAAGRPREALPSLRTAVTLAPDTPESRLHLLPLIHQLTGSDL